ncbi:sensor domain-containing diguanylate cyclase [Psychromonas algicola]|uniref:sensor domain-containing diguanylate cyclase n=1 Tax=Psychromonas algicola TaxID=2555642 RepID=UPI0010680AB5|nr:GGDEF domain-containing protein [Psychromonas sp. RZ5]TEW48975.1 GGDEF domain-containing protein [Psychromonas sp. RZ5]
MNLEELDFIKTFQHLNCCAFMKDKNGHYTFANDAACKAFSVEREAIIGRSDSDLFVVLPDQHNVKKEIKALQGKLVSRVEKKQMKDGEIKHYQSVRSPMYSKNGEVVGLIGIEIDISDTIDKCNSLQELALRDAVTGLYNRRFLEAQLTAEVSLHHRKKQPLSLIMLDIDDFKTINDQYGHEIGDDALVIVSQLIQQALRSEDICCRFGGDEFSILLPFTEQPRAFLLAERIRELVSQHLFTANNGGRFTVSISLGVGCLSENMQSEDLKRSADQALLMAKKQHKNNCLVSCNLKGKIVSCYQECSPALSACPLLKEVN